MSDSKLRIMMLGDFVGRPARDGLRKCYSYIRNTLEVDLLVVNAENVSGGNCIVPSSAMELKEIGVDIITLGDHAFQKREMHPFLDDNASWCIRPANYPEGAAGKGETFWKHSDSNTEVYICNLIGRVFLQGSLDCPFRAIDNMLQKKPESAKIVLCDFHAEATSEKQAFAYYLDGRASLVVGTHTHVQTADARILPGGTGKITDLGMSGCIDTVIGMDTSVALDRFITGLPRAYKLGKGEMIRLCGILATVDCESGKALSIEAVQLDPDAF